MVKKLLLSIFLCVIMGASFADEPKISLKVFMADWCPYCQKLDDDYLTPMDSWGSYKNKLKSVTQYNIDISPEIEKYYVPVVPLMLFVDANTGEELYRVPGLPGDQIFWEIFDGAIKEANKEWLRKSVNQ